MMTSLLGLLLELAISAFPIRSIDSGTVHKALVRAGVRVSPAPVDDWQVMGPVSGDTAVVFRQGTEVARIPWNPSLEANSSLVSKSPEDSLWVPRFRKWAAPPKGGRLALGFSSGIATGTSPIAMATVDADLKMGWKDLGSIGAGARVERLLATPPIAVPLGDSIVPLVVDWTFSVCGPVVCLEERTRTLPIGAETWLQPRLSDDLAARRDGSFWKASADSAFGGSWETRLVGHLGILEYSWSRCPGLWNGALQSLGLKGASPNGVAWGAGAIWTRERMATWVELGVAELPLPLARIRKQSIAWSPIQARLDWRSFRQFSASLRTTISFPDPFPFSQPGPIRP